MAFLRSKKIMIVIFNGPPGTGKDEAAAFFSRRFGFKHLSFKHQLFKETIKHFGVGREWFMSGYNDRARKEVKELDLKGHSRRTAMIHVSEDIIKPTKGNDYFGRMVAQEIEEGEHYAISDGGFVEELNPIIEKVGQNNIAIVQLTRQGCSFKNDSRRYFNGKFTPESNEIIINYETEVENDFILDMPASIQTYRIHNNGTIKDFYQALFSVEYRLKWTERLLSVHYNHPIRGEKIAL
jgi:hypothetical protein